MATTFTFAVDCSTPAGLAALDAALVSRSYWVGFSLSQCDLDLHKAIATAPDAAKYPNVARYFAHIAALVSEGAAVSSCAACGSTSVGGAVAAGAKKAAKAADSDDDDDDSDGDDLFGDDDDAPKAPKKKPVAKAVSKKKPAKVAKTQVVFDLKPEDAETDLKVLEADVRKITMDGLSWGQEFGVADVAFGIKKLVVQCVIEDEKVFVDDLEDKIYALEGAQSMDIIAMNKMS